MNPHQFREYVVKPALDSIEFHSLAAEALIMGTGAQESKLNYVKQLGTGPAMGLFQMEPATHEDIWANYLQHRPDLAASIRRAIEFNGGIPQPTRLMWDLRYATIMCRIHYLRVPEALPAADDIWQQAYYWKRYYNTERGAGTEQEFVDNYRLIR